MKSNVLKKVFTGTLLCLIVLLTVFAFGQTAVAEDSAPADEVVETPAEGTESETPDEDAAPSEDDSIVDLHFDKDNVIAALNIMWKGVLAIFITIAIIIVVSILMNKACNKASEAVKKKQERIETQMRSEEKENRE